MGYVYKHIRLDTNEVFYIGIGGFDKYEKEFSYKRAYNKRRNNLWQKITNKSDYNVEIILENLTWKEAIKKEIEFIKYYGRINLNTGTLSNLTDGGDGTKNKIISLETKNRMSESKKGTKLSEETKRKISKLHTGRIKSEDEIKKLSKALLGHKISEETKKKISEIKKGKIAHNRIKIQAYNFITNEYIGTYNSYVDCGNALNICNNKIGLVINGKRKHTGGYFFKII